MIKNWNEVSLDDLYNVAKELIEFASEIKVFAIYGEMGAGKTTFVKSLCKVLNVVDEVQSPTFSIVNEYLTTNSESIYHFDFYRINKIDEVFDIGYERYFFSGSYCFIEWPEKIESLLNFRKANIFISSDFNIRNISCNYE